MHTHARPRLVRVLLPAKPPAPVPPKADAQTSHLEGTEPRAAWLGFRSLPWRLV